MDPQTLEALKWLGGALLALLTGAAGGAKMAQRQLANTAGDPELLRSLESRLNRVAEDVVTRAHGFRQELHVMRAEFSTLDKSFVRLDERVLRATDDVAEVKSSFLSELRRLEDSMADRFDRLEKKVDRITPRSGGIRRNTDDEGDEN